MTRLIVHEDEHLLVVNKPAGWNTHAPSPWAGEGVYDWLRHREPRWARLALVHRLDKATSGLLVMAKTPLANRSLTEQFTQRQVRKRYVLLASAAPPHRDFTARSRLVRVGDRYARAEGTVPAPEAVTRFIAAGTAAGGRTRVEAEPLTGRTHQIRVQAAEHGFPVVGDALYGGAPAARLCLHAAELEFAHPEGGAVCRFIREPDFAAAPAEELREAVVDPDETNAWRLSHGEPPLPEWLVDRLGDWLLAAVTRLPVGEAEERLADEALGRWSERYGLRGVYQQVRPRDGRSRATEPAAPRLRSGQPAPDAFGIRENGVAYELRLGEGAAVGLFLDQRDNRRRLRVNHVAAGFPAFPSDPSGAGVLNLFAYTCGFSVCAALAGARTTSVDLSRKALDWGRRNLSLNGLDPAAHEFFHGDAFDELRRLRRKGRRFAVAILDPPTFSTSKTSGVFRAETDYGRLIRDVLPVLAPGGTLLASTNAAGWAPERFLATVREAIAGGGRRLGREHYAPQPPDFPISRAEPGYLKTVWLQVEGA